jgi:lycopene beta-cyclase
MNNFDYIIVGGGAAGLMMAYKMAKDIFFDNKTILILDQEKKNRNDRTWCFWEEKQGDWDSVLHTSWNKIIFKSNSLHKEEKISPYQYKMIRSLSFYQKIWSYLDQKKNITFIEAKVVEIIQNRENAKVITSQNEYFSKKIINSILFSNAYKKQTQYPVLQQHFVGYFIKTKQPIFDNRIATFMDFKIPQKGNTRFIYFLPFSKNEALFEYTLFSEKLLDYEEYTTAIEDYLAEKNIIDYEIIEKEQGSIPMTSYKFWKNNSNNVIHIGTAGGWSKASTGFTFKNIDRNTTKLLSYLKEDKPLQSFHKKNKFWLYDLLLLDILSKNNQLGSVIFSQLFQRNASPKILKFLDEETSFLEEINIFSKMPKRLFVKALIKRLF